MVYKYKRKTEVRIIDEAKVNDAIHRIQQGSVSIRKAAGRASERSLQSLARFGAISRPVSCLKVIAHFFVNNFFSTNVSHKIFLEHLPHVSAILHTEACFCCYCGVSAIATCGILRSLTPPDATIVHINDGAGINLRTGIFVL